MVDQESSRNPSPALPETHSPAASLELIRADVRILQEVQANPNGYEFTAQLPEVVGFVPENEREFFDTVPEKFLGTSKNREHPWPQGLIGLHNLAARDHAKLGFANSELASFEIERKITPAGLMARGPNRFHPDKVKNPLDIMYMVANLYPTFCYHGPARLMMNPFSPEEIVVDPDSLDDSIALVSAPRYAVVRYTGAMIHIPQIFETEAERTWTRMRFSGTHSGIRTE